MSWKKTLISFSAVMTIMVTAISISSPSLARSELKKPREVKVCTSAKKGLKFYRDAYDENMNILQRRNDVKKLKPKNCANARYLVKRWQKKAYATERVVERLSIPKNAICYVFGPYCKQALVVAWCESRFSINATNGQYEGLFQMGSSERRLFGHGRTALEQSFAAHKYFVNSGRDWSPWSCKPWYAQ